MNLYTSVRAWEAAFLLEKLWSASGIIANFFGLLIILNNSWASLTNTL